jgi:hypothetical protein
VREAVLHVVAWLAASASGRGALVGAVVDRADDVEASVTVEMAGPGAAGDAAAQQMRCASLLLMVLDFGAAVGCCAAVSAAEPLHILCRTMILAQLFTS